MREGGAQLERVARGLHLVHEQAPELHVERKQQLLARPGRDAEHARRRLRAPDLGARAASASVHQTRLRVGVDTKLPGENKNKLEVFARL